MGTKKSRIHRTRSAQYRHRAGQGCNHHRAQQQRRSKTEGPGNNRSRRSLLEAGKFRPLARCVDAAIPSAGTAAADQYLAHAAEAYQQVLSDDAYKQQHDAIVSARFGLAAIDENRHDWASAQKHLQAIVDDADVTGPLHDLATRQIAALPYDANFALFVAAHATNGDPPSAPRLRCCRPHDCCINPNSP